MLPGAVFYASFTNATKGITNEKIYKKQQRQFFLLFLIKIQPQGENNNDRFKHNTNHVEHDANHIISSIIIEFNIEYDIIPVGNEPDLRLDKEQYIRKFRWK
jgi:hypothetical protein